MRLSRDDEKAGESLSIENQRNILQRYTEEHGGIVVDEYIDDGWSGTDFERPAVQRLLEDAKQGKIDTIVVKDLSRFGRNYIQVGQYVDYIFPAYGIRFIALSDNVDTAERSSTGMDMMPIMNVFNEWHAANTSKKIRAVLEANWRKGKFTNWAYPYGYKTGQDENRRAIIDEEAAKNVRRIYDLRLQGKSVRTIARTLTDEGIPNPTAYYTRLDGKKSERTGSAQWSPKTVSEILKNETYTGTLIQHRSARFSYKNHTVINIPTEERFVLKNAHTPIIPFNVWERVQQINKAKVRSDKSGTIHCLSGLLICAGCGKKLKFKSSKNSEGIYCCRTYIELGKKYCTSHSISENQIKSIVLQDIHHMLAELKIDERKEREHFFSEKNHLREKTRLLKEKDLQKLKNRLVELDKLIKATFESQVLGSLPQNICRELCENYQEEKRITQSKVSDLEKNLRKEADADDESESYISCLKKYAQCGQLTRELCLLLIDKIIIGNKNKDGTPRQIEIHYKFSKPKSYVFSAAKQTDFFP